MEYTDDDIELAVRANVEDFYGDPMVEPDEIPQMAVEDAFGAYDIDSKRQDELWDKMLEVAQEEYDRMNGEDHP